MSYNIDIINKTDESIDVSRLTQATTVVLSQEEQGEDTSLSIVITDNTEVQALNLQFRQIDAPTDVLSFPSDMPIFEDEPLYLGDIIIALPYATSQATQHQHNLDDSLCLLVVHGCLHLLGYDHDTDNNKHKMWEEQAKALTALDIDTQIVPSLEG